VVEQTDPEDTSEDATPLQAFDAMCDEMAKLLEAAKPLIEPEDDKDSQGDADEDEGIVGADVVPETP
jgi:hypothetical protein